LTALLKGFDSEKKDGILSAFRLPSRSIHVVAASRKENDGVTKQLV
jgi:hypothetical protein